MKCDLSKERIVDYFYAELQDADRQEFETHLESCQACRTEVESLRQTSRLLKAWPDEDSNLRLHFVKEPRRFANASVLDWIHKLNWQKIGIGFAVGFASILITLAVINLEASYSEGKFNIRVSLFPREAIQPEPGKPEPDMLAQPVTQREFNTWRKTQLELVQSMIENAELRRRQENELLLTKFAQDLDTQRREDLRVMGRGLEVFQLANENELRRTHQILNQLIEATYIPDNRSNRLENK